MTRVNERNLYTPVTTGGPTGPAALKTPDATANLAKLQTDLRQLQTDLFDAQKALGTGGGLPTSGFPNLSALGFKASDADKLGNALPNLVNAAKALATQPPQWDTAMRELDTLGRQVPELAAKLSSAIVDSLPPAIKGELAKLNLSSKDLQQIGSALPHLLAAGQALAKGDFAEAAKQAQVVAHVAPDVAGRLTQTVLDKVPAGVKEQIAKLGLNGQDLAELGKALPNVLDAADALRRGDWKGAAQTLGQVSQLAPGLTEKLGKAILDKVPAEIKERAAQFGLTPERMAEAGAALPHLLEAGEKSAKGDWKGAIEAFTAAIQAAPNLSMQAMNAVQQVIPPRVIETLGKLGITGQDLAQAGAALPHALRAANALSKGDWKTALAEAKQVGQVAPELVNKLGQGIYDRVPQGVKDQLSKLGVNAQNLKEVGAALPHVLGAARALEKGDLQALLAETKAIGQAAPQLTQKLGQAIYDRVPQGVKDQLSKLGVNGQNLAEVGAALPHAIDAATKLANGDWQGALTDLQAVGAAAPQLTQKLGQAIYDRVPQGVKDSLGKLGINSDNLKEAGAALPHVLDAATKLANGDWEGALNDVKAVGAAAPQLTQKLGQAIYDRVPQGVKDRLEKLGVNSQNLREAGAAIPAVLNAAKALENGDWQGALDGFQAIHDAAPHLVDNLGKAILDRIPPGVKDRLTSLGVTGSNLGKLGKALPDVINFAQGIHDGNYGQALASLDKTLGTLSPQLRDKLGGAAERALGLPPGGLTDALANGKTVQFGQGNISKGWGNLPRSVGSNLRGPDAILAAAKDPTAGLGPGVIPLASGTFSFDKSLYSAAGSFGTPGSGISGQGSVEFGRVVAAGGAEVHADLAHLQLGASANVAAGVYLVNAQGSLQADYGWGSTRLAGQAMVGAEANANASVNFDPLHGTAMAHVGAEAFAGARAGVQLQQTVGPIGAEADFEVEAGIGATFKVDAGLQNGKLSFKFDIGACLGIGFELKFGFSLDFKKLADEIGSVLKKGGQLIADGAKAVVKGIEWVGDKVGDAAKKVGNAIADGAKAVGNAVADGVKSVGKAIGKVFSGW